MKSIIKNGMTACIVLIFILCTITYSLSAETGAGSPIKRIAHYVPSSHWDREWYDSFQGFRMRLVPMLDELFETMDNNPAYTSFTMDGQVIPAYDYLEIRPEKLAMVQQFARDGRFILGPWYVLPDEWLVCGESIIRNLQMGKSFAVKLGATPSRVGFVCDIFGHTGQLPQIFDQMNIPSAFVWRGTNETDWKCNFNWKAPDGTVIPTFRFEKIGYCTFSLKYRTGESTEEKVGHIVEFVLFEEERSPVWPLLLFDGCDHQTIEPTINTLIEMANKRLEPRGIQIIHSTLDNYTNDLLKDRAKINKTISGELRDSGKFPESSDHQWLIPGVLSSRIYLKQRNAACEDELCLWAEPFSAFAAELGNEYPIGYLNASWKHLIENHPHDSICGCSIDQVHQDMIYRFDQSLGISSRLTSQALKTITAAASPKELSDTSFVVGVFNATSEDINEPVDIDIPMPEDWPYKFREFFGYEDKYSFKLRNARGEEVPYQLVAQTRDKKDIHFNYRNIVSLTAPMKVPAFGYTTFTVEPIKGPTRYLGSMKVSHGAIENEVLHVQAESNGTITVTDKRSGRKFEQLLTFEDRADIGDGWYHGVAVNDQTYFSTASGADVAVIADGISKATLRITVVMNIPKRFDFHIMERTGETAPLKIVSDITLRKGSDRVEVTTVVENTILDHRVRVLFPTNLKGDTYICDSAFDCVERPVALADDNNSRRELDVETRPQVTWTAFSDGKTGLAIVSRGQPESAVINTPERPIALTLFRAFGRGAFLDGNPGGQIQGTLTFRYEIVPFNGTVPVKKLFLLGQRVNTPVKTSTLSFNDKELQHAGTLSREHSFLKVDGNVVVTSVQRDKKATFVRFFNPLSTREMVTVGTGKPSASAKCFTLDGREDTKSTVQPGSDGIKVSIQPKRITTLMLE
jgi:alpha-mannosidase/mannosylglycerate hydrolase